MGREVKPEIAMDIMLYSFASIFHINPEEAKNTPLSTIIKMLELHGVVEEIKADEIEKQTRALKK